ncbi:MAG: serine hydrolase domain-containing protein [Limosilactobacillus gorillae]|uniref:serine hydrolase domain-containing protein n=1 Tax=Limosilactobacillus gorillae TaxID=1450649 RepID=UPI000A4DA9E4|nr:serine hydrolase domain-containing protein [Limosilactobacillus gorillae]MDO4855166.1 serine hydrolase domain-containing protein [Limosilactobacillus gorillae]
MKSRWLIGTALGLLAGIGLTGIRPRVIHAPEVISTTKRLQLTLKDVLKSNHINGIILIGSGDRPTVIENELVGKNSRRLVSLERYFPTASLQKLLTGLAVYTLVKEGKLSTNTTLARFYPQIPHAKEITIGNLMSHTSGLSDTQTIAPRVLMSQQEQVAYSLKHFASSGKTSWNYSNIDYVLLASIVSKASGQSYDHFVREQILKPWGITEIKPFTALTANQISKSLLPTASWTGLRRAMSATFGAGNYLATPRGYWQLVSHLMDDPAASNWLHRHADEKTVTYFGGVYFSGNTFHANGGYAGYSAIASGDLSTKRRMIFFTNNVNLGTAKNIRTQLNRYYYSKQAQELD